MRHFELRLLKAIYDHQPIDFKTLLKKIQPPEKPPATGFRGLWRTIFTNEVSGGQLTVGLINLINNKLVTEDRAEGWNTAADDRKYRATGAGYNQLKRKRLVT